MAQQATRVGAANEISPSFITLHRAHVTNDDQRMLSACYGNVQSLHIFDKTNVRTAGTNGTEDNKVAFLALKSVYS